MSRAPVIGNVKLTSPVVMGAAVQLPTPPSKQPISPSVAPSLTPTLTPTPSSSETAITYSDTGFSPKIVTIKKGDTLTFNNGSETDMWVASNYFPTSTLYPGTADAKCKNDPIPAGMFEECTGVSNGSHWSF